jgi:hypothetical protein
MCRTVATWVSPTYKSMTIRSWATTVALLERVEA